MSKNIERLMPKSEQLAAKVMDGEAVVINLATGVYYSMDKSGGLAWSLIEQGRSIDDIAGIMAKAYELPAEQARADLDALISELISEDLVEATANDAGATLPDLPAIPSGQVYEPPKLNIYRDMEDLLALDPPMPGLQETPWTEEGGSKG